MVSTTTSHSRTPTPPHNSQYYTTTCTDSNTVLTLHDITKTYHSKTVLEDVTFSVLNDEKIIIVGENGVGKSTLLKTLARCGSHDGGGQQQQYTPDSGSVTVNGTVGYLAQEFHSYHGKSVVECMVELAEHQDLLDFLHDTPYTGTDNGSWMHDFTACGGYEFLPLLSQLGLQDIDLHQPFSNLSGGQKTKMALTALAVKQPDLLLLDEPTNHLDIQALLWLERFLAAYDGAWLVITHDRTLINNSRVQHIVELTPDTHQLVKFKGGYDDYLQAKHSQYLREKLAREQTQKSIDQLSSKLSATHVNSTRKFAFRTDQDKVTFNHNVENKQVSNAGKVNQLNSRITALNSHINDLPVPRQQISFTFADSQVVMDDDVAVKIDDVMFEYTPHVPVLQHVSLQVRRQDRLVITGVNGAGKSTLLKLIAGMLQPTDGMVKLTGGARIGYLDQEQESIASDMTAIEYCGRHATKANHNSVVGQLRKLGLFDKLDISQKLCNLSVGRQRKVQLADILLQKPNVLLLDEPTNHIDLQSVEEIERQLLTFPGAIVAISHDRWFIEKVATRVVSFDDINKI